jgi:hypothetical protein
MKPSLDSGSGNAASRKPRTKVMQHRQAIMASIVSGCWNSWMGLAFYNSLKPTKKLEKVDDIKQSNCSVYFESNITECI